MAIKLSDKPNTSAIIDGEYPYGDIRNVVGSTPGTPVSREVYADFHQFFEKLMDEGEITHNGTLDNDMNDFQLFEALKAWQKLRFEGFDFTTFNAFYLNCPLLLEGGTQYNYPATTQGITEISGSNDEATFDLASLGFQVPIGHVHRIKIKSDLDGTYLFRILLNASNVGTNPPLIKEGVTAADAEYTYTIGAIMSFVRTEDGWQLFEEEESRTYSVIRGVLKDGSFTEFENDTGETITYSKDSQTYKLTASSGLFSDAKTFVSFGDVEALTGGSVIQQVFTIDSTTVIAIDGFTFDSSASILAYGSQNDFISVRGIHLEIRVYP